MLSSLQGFQDSAKKLVADNATTILTAGGVVGTVTTGVLAWRGGFKAAEIFALEIEKRRYESAASHPAEDEFKEETPLELITTIDKARLFFPHVVPPIIIGGVTIGAIVWSNRMSAQKAAALVAAYSVSERQFREYKDKVAEKLTGPKQQQIDDELAQERVNHTPGSETLVIIEGSVLCFDELTGRYFESTMERIRKAVNDTNEQILNRDAVSASYFYDLLGLPETTWTQEVGWNTDNLLDLSYTTCMSYDKRPCISINPKYLPTASYDRHTY